MEVFGEKKLRHYPGTGAGIRDGVHLKNVLKHRLAEDPSIVIVMDMRTSTLDSSNQWLLQTRSKAELRYVTEYTNMHPKN